MLVVQSTGAVTSKHWDFKLAYAEIPKLMFFCIISRCDSDYDCGSQHSCKGWCDSNCLYNEKNFFSFVSFVADFLADFKCQPACNECGIGADCRVVNHRPVCECPKNYFGNPLVECRAECKLYSWYSPFSVPVKWFFNQCFWFYQCSGYGDRDCPSGRPACIYGICKNPCDGACGKLILRCTNKQV